MNILEKIAADKRKEIEEKKELYPVKFLEQSIYFNTAPVSLKHYLTRPDKVGIIAEIKRKSPSRGTINVYFSVENLSIGYMQAGASALSILTDEHYFGGTNEDLTIARNFNFCPILRKDFILDEYQIFEVKSIGADAILLISRILKNFEIKKLAARAKELGLEVLLEIHQSSELEGLNENIDIVGINNRNLDDFTVSVERSFELGEKIPKDFTKISESGLENAVTINKLKKAGFQGFLVGERFMRENHPQSVCARLVKELRREKNNGN